MNKKILLTTLGLGVSALILSSYHDGPAHHGAGNFSGSSNNVNCTSCHQGAVNSNFGLSLVLTDDATNTVVTNNKYIPGHTYTVAFKGYLPSSSNPKLGFQASVVNAANANSGTLSAADANTGTAAGGGINVIEHTAPLAKTDTLYLTHFKWQAPAAGSGNAIIYAAMLAINNNGANTGDVCNTIVNTLSEAVTTGVHEVSKTDLIQVFPSLAQGQINVRLNQLAAGKYDFNIVSLDGKTVLQSKTNFTGGDMKIDIAGFAKGMYVLTIHGKDSYQSVRFVKQ